MQKLAVKLREDPINSADHLLAALHAAAVSGAPQAGLPDEALHGAARDLVSRTAAHPLVRRVCACGYGWGATAAIALLASETTRVVVLDSQPSAGKEPSLEVLHTLFPGRLEVP
ncbi:hypothetical protein T484DRAFT_1783335 [Baffinella frigidus]|nr:hypothetical protein T484DRAFT_1783335 [Cryptophyta sp. CCMP2293]